MVVLGSRKQVGAGAGDWELGYPGVRGRKRPREGAAPGLSPAVQNSWMRQLQLRQAGLVVWPFLARTTGLSGLSRAAALGCSRQVRAELN